MWPNWRAFGLLGRSLITLLFSVPFIARSMACKTKALRDWGAIGTLAESLRPANVGLCAQANSLSRPGFGFFFRHTDEAIVRARSRCRAYVSCGNETSGTAV